MTGRRDLLLVCYYFPPYPDIGGRRWAKFSKYLSRKNFRIHVIAAINPYPTESNWLADVNDNPNILVYPIPSGYPEAVRSPKISIKIRNRLAPYWVRLISKGTHYDRTIFWKKRLLSKTREIISQHDVRNIIVTGAPFHSFHHMLEIKNEFPDIRLILDYRDTWITSVVYGMQSLSPRKLALEKRMEREALHGADLILSPHDPHKLLGDALCHAGMNKMAHELSHAFDPEDIPSIENKPSGHDKITLIYGGTLYVGVDKYLMHLSEALCGIREHYHSLYEKLEIHFYVREVGSRAQLLLSHPGVIFFHEPVAKHTYFKAISGSDICLLLPSFYNKHYLTTKYVECLAMHKPFILIGEEGGLSQHVEDNSLGKNLTGGALTYKALAEAIESLSKGLGYDKAFDVSGFSFENKTEELVKYLQQ